MAVLKNAAKTRRVPAPEVLAALAAIKKAKVEPSAFLETLGGSESPGRTWMLIFTAQVGLPPALSTGALFRFRSTDRPVFFLLISGPSRERELLPGHRSSTVRRRGELLSKPSLRHRCISRAPRPASPFCDCKQIIFPNHKRDCFDRIKSQRDNPESP